MEGSLLCQECQERYVTPVPSRCYRCHALASDFRTCKSCRSSSRLYSVMVRTDYQGLAKELVHRLKFARAKAAVLPMADSLAPLIAKPAQVLLVPIPTASSRRRQRGYDQAELLAKELARRTGIPCSFVLSRRGQARQVGARRAERLDQLRDALYVRRAADLSETTIILVDDVVTTGATLEAAAHVLKVAGAKRVQAVVFAQA